MSHLNQNLHAQALPLNSYPCTADFVGHYISKNFSGLYSKGRNIARVRLQLYGTETDVALNIYPADPINAQWVTIAKKKT